MICHLPYFVTQYARGVVDPTQTPRRGGSTVNAWITNNKELIVRKFILLYPHLNSNYIRVKQKPL